MTEAEHTTAAPLTVPEITALVARIRAEVATAVVGMENAIEFALAAILAGGHALFEDVPGLGKTLAARSIASAIGLDFRRLQCTPDLLPADITGSFVYAPATTSFEFRPGPIIATMLMRMTITGKAMTVSVMRMMIASVRPP